jgi:exonuclease VII large subunit
MKSYITSMFNTKDGFILNSNDQQNLDYEVAELQRELLRRYKKTIDQHNSEMEVLKQHLNGIMQEEVEAAQRRHDQIEIGLRNELEVKRE